MEQLLKIEDFKDFDINELPTTQSLIQDEFHGYGYVTVTKISDAQYLIKLQKWITLDISEPINKLKALYPQSHISGFKGKVETITTKKRFFRKQKEQIATLEATITFPVPSIDEYGCIIYKH